MAKKRSKRQVQRSVRSARRGVDSDHHYYYVTIRTRNNVGYLGTAVKGKTVLNALGKTAQKYWHEIPQRFPTVTLDACVVMPNYINGILAVTMHGKPQRRERRHREMQPATADSRGISVGAIVAAFKLWIGQYARVHNVPLAWQSRFSEGRIHTRSELIRLRRCISERASRMIHAREERNSRVALSRYTMPPLA